MFLPRQITHNYSTRNRSQPNFHISKSVKGENFLRYYVPHIFQGMPVNSKAKLYTHSANGFTNYAKSHILANYETECTMLNCYVCNT